VTVRTIKTEKTNLLNGLIHTFKNYFSNIAHIPNYFDAEYSMIIIIEVYTVMWSMLAKITKFLFTDKLLQDFAQEPRENIDKCTFPMTETLINLIVEELIYHNVDPNSSFVIYTT